MPMSHSRSEYKDFMTLAPDAYQAVLTRYPNDPIASNAQYQMGFVQFRETKDGSRDQQYISNYATLYVKDVVTRVEGVGNVIVFGARDYSMRVWLDPARVASHNMTGSEVVLAMQAAKT